MADSEWGRREPVLTATGEQPMPSHTMPLYHETKVVLTDIDIPFNRLVWIMAKWILASIPAITLATVIFYGLLLLFFLMFGAPFWME